MQFPRLAVRDFDHGDAEMSEDFEVRPRIAANVGYPADQKHGDVHAALDERARDDEAVAAVVAAPAQHGHLPLGQVRVDRLHGRHHLPAGVFHEDERRDADVFDRPAIGFPHLGGVQDAHLGCNDTSPFVAADA